MDEAVIARRVVVRGRVQGVSFRDSCRYEAARRGIAGWVRNQPDGTVSAHFEGPAAAVNALVEWTHRGPAHAAVVGVEVEETDPEGVVGFRVA